MVEVEGLAPPEWLDVSQLPWLLGDTSIESGATDGCCPRYLLLDRQATLLVCPRSHEIWSGGRDLHPLPRLHGPVLR